MFPVFCFKKRHVREALLVLLIITLIICGLELKHEGGVTFNCLKLVGFCNHNSIPLCNGHFQNLFYFVSSLKIQT